MVGENGKPHIIIDETAFYLNIHTLDEMTQTFLELWINSKKITKKEQTTLGDYDDPTIEINSPDRNGVIVKGGPVIIEESEVPKTIPAETSKKVPADVLKRSHKKTHATFIELTEKHCKRCNKTKPISDFNKSKADRTGHQSYCRSCSNEINSGNKTKHVEERKKKPDTKPESIIKPEKQPDTITTISEPVKKKTLGWTPERDQKLRDAFKKDLGVSGIYDADILPGFTITEIRHRCQELKLVDPWGVPTKQGGG